MWFNKKKNKTLKKRKFEAGQYHRTMNGWITGSSNLFNEEIRQDLESLRARSRDASINDVYARRYFKALTTNVVGAKGIECRFKIEDRPNALDKYANEKMTSAFKKWSRNVTVDGLSFVEAQKLFIETTARDGEVLVQMLRGQQYGPYGFKLRFIEADYLDVHYNKTLPNGNIIRSSIEYNTLGGIEAYHIFEYHPQDRQTSNIVGNKRIRIKASDIIHGVNTERASQGRGFPWLSAALVSLNHLKEYQKTELIAARVASAKMGFFTRSGAMEELDEDDSYDVMDEQTLIQDVEPGLLEALPEGYDFKTFDPQNPNGNFPAFVKTILRGIAASVGVCYHTLSNDLESTSYSSLRQGAMDERDTWKNLQEWMIGKFLQPVFESWLSMALMTNNDIPFPFDRIEKYSNIEWMPRAFNYIDVSKETLAIKTQLEQKIRSKTDVVASMGRKFEDVIQEIAEENALMKKLGVTEDQLMSKLTNTDIATNNLKGDVGLEEQIARLEELIESER